MLAKSLGIQTLVVIVNKMDDCRWGKKRYDQIVNGLTPFLHSVGYTEKDIIWVPIVGLTGDNILEPVSREGSTWYKGPTLIEILDDLKL